MHRAVKSGTGTGVRTYAANNFGRNKSGTNVQPMLYVGITEGVAGRSALVSV